jgi:hypothetical protein
MLLFLSIILLLGAVLILLNRLWTRALQEIEKIELQELVDDAFTLAKRDKARYTHPKEKKY